MSLVLLQGQVQQKVEDCDTSTRCINKRGILGKAVLLEEKNIDSPAYQSAEEWKVIVQRKKFVLITNRFLSSSPVIRTMCMPE